jgi:GPI ethanolamine phosphate transferase 1
MAGLKIGRLGRMGFLALAVVFHFIYAMSIFDIYFVSPIVHGMRAYSVEEEFARQEAPAQRLVLFVGTWNLTSKCLRPARSSSKSKE